MRLKEYVAKLQVYINTGQGDLEVIYASDDEGNKYRKVINTNTLVQVHDLTVVDLEVVGYLGDEGIDKQDINAIIIN